MDRAAFVSNFVAQYGVSVESAELAADRAGIRAEITLTPAQFAQQQRDARIREKEEQHEIVKRFRVCGFSIWNLSQARASKIAPGVPDLFLTHKHGRAALFWECKRQVGGRVSTAQLDFRDECERCGVTCMGGDRYDAERYLVMNHFATMGTDGKLTPAGAGHSREEEG